MRLTVNRVTYHVEMQGSGPAVFFLHGFTGSSENWTPHLAALRAFTTVRVDFLGHGRSDAPAAMHRYGMEACVDDVLADPGSLGHTALRHRGLFDGRPGRHASRPAGT